MAEDRIALLELLRNAGHEGEVDFLREGVRALAQGLMELEVSGRIGAERYERNDGRASVAWQAVQPLRDLVPGDE